MENLTQTALRKITSEFTKVINMIIQKIFPSERKFCRIWPAINKIEGLLVSPCQERWLFKKAKSLRKDAIIVEIGSFKGRSTCCLALGCKNTNKHVFAIDTFNGNNVDFDKRDFFKEFWFNIQKCDVSAYVTPIRKYSTEVANTWNKNIDMLFIDGSHQYEDVIADFSGFFPCVVAGGIVAVHDVEEKHPGSLKAWHEHIKYHLKNVGYCSTLAYGIKP